MIVEFTNDIALEEAQELLLSHELRRFDDRQWVIR